MIEKQLGAYVVIKTKSISAEWVCPYCNEENSTPIDCLDLSDLWYGEESADCWNCGQEVSFSEGCEYDV